MTLSMETLVKQTYVPALTVLGELLDKGAAHAAATGRDMADLLGARLYEDMFTLTQQVQTACYQALLGLARMTGQEPPKPDRSAVTLDALKALVAATAATVSDTPAAAFAGAEDRIVSFALGEGTKFEADGLTYFLRWSIPNFDFHVVTAYGILRHNGVPIGKKDFVSHTGALLKPVTA